MTPLKLKKHFFFVFFALTLVQNLHAFQVVPPPPPPGGSELWSGTSEIFVPGVPSGEQCPCIEYTYILFFRFCSRRSDCGTEDQTIIYNWTAQDLLEALNGGFIDTSLPGDFRGYSQIIQGIRSGILQLDNDDWDVLVDWASDNNAGGIQESCNLARSDNYDPPGCASVVPLPKSLSILLLLSVFGIWFYNSKKFSVFADGKNG